MLASSPIELAKSDLRHVVQHLPRDIRDMLSNNHGKVFVAGGFIREIIAGGTVPDIDIFTDTKERASLLANDLVAARGGKAAGVRRHDSRNAITILTPNRLPVQFITRWTFETPHELVASFDFTVCQAAIWRGGNQSDSPWCGLIHYDFYKDLAGRNLVYTSPQREEEAGGSLMRVLKFLKRGYGIRVGSLGDVLGRIIDKVHVERGDKSGLPTGAIVEGILREVDPLMVIDGFYIEDDHESPPGTEGEG